MRKGKSEILRERKMTKEREGPYNGVPVNILYERERKRDRERNCERDKEKVSLRD